MKIQKKTKPKHRGEPFELFIMPIIVWRHHQKVNQKKNQWFLFFQSFVWFSWCFCCCCCTSPFNREITIWSFYRRNNKQIKEFSSNQRDHNVNLLYFIAFYYIFPLELNVERRIWMEVIKHRNKVKTIPPKSKTRHEK